MIRKTNRMTPVQRLIVIYVIMNGQCKSKEISEALSIPLHIIKREIKPIIGRMLLKKNLMYSVPSITLAGAREEPSLVGVVKGEYPPYRGVTLPHLSPPPRKGIQSHHSCAMIDSLSLLRYWNEKKYTRSHRQKNSKTYQSALFMLQELASGEIGSEKYPIQSDSIPAQWKGKGWDEEEIYRMIDVYDQARSPSGWMNKGTCPGLSNAIYNPRTFNSMMLVALKCSPYRHGCEPRKKMKRTPQHISAMADVFAITFECKRKELIDLSLLIDNETDKWKEFDDPVVNERVERYFGDSYSIASYIGNWCNDSGLLLWDEFTPGMIRPGTKIWKKFVKHIKADLNIDLETGKRTD